LWTIQSLFIYPTSPCGFLEDSLPCPYFFELINEYNIVFIIRQNLIKYTTTTKEQSILEGKKENIKRREHTLKQPHLI